MKDREVYEIDGKKEQLKDVMTPMIANIQEASFADLRAALLSQIANYINNTKVIIEKQKYVPSIFCKHGTVGLVRAEKLMKTINFLKDNDTQGLLDSISTLDGGNYNQTSLKTFIAKAFYEVGTRKGAENHVSGTRFTDNNYEDQSVGIVISSVNRHPHWAAKADIDVAGFLKKVIKTIADMLSQNNQQPTKPPV